MVTFNAAKYPIQTKMKHTVEAVKRPHVDQGDSQEDVHQPKVRKSAQGSSSSEWEAPKLLTNSTLVDEADTAETQKQNRNRPLELTVEYDSEATEENSQSMLETDNDKSPQRENTLDVPGPSRMEKIKSVQADAERISELLGRKDVQVLYERIKMRRGDPERLTKVTNECLEETSKEVNDDQVANGVRNNNQKEPLPNSPEGGPSSTTDIKSVISDISLVMKAVKKAHPEFDIDPNEVYSKLETNLNENDRVDMVVKALIEEEQGKREKDEPKLSSTDMDIFQQVQQVLLKHPDADANRVFNLLEVFGEDPNCIDKVIEHLQNAKNKLAPSKDTKPSTTTDSNTSDSQSKALNHNDSFKNDPLYQDMLKLKRIFADRPEDEIYAHLEVYHDKANRIDRVMEEFLGNGASLNQSFDMPPDDLKLTLDSVDNSQEYVVDSIQADSSDVVLLKFKQDVDILKSVFPDCEPQYIIQQLQDHFDFAGRVDMVTAILMNQKTYPQIKTLSKADQQRKRLRNLTLDIPEFLRMFPDPNEVFYDEKKEMEKLYKDHVKVQLCTEFKAWKRKYVREKLEVHNHHYLPTLRDIEADMILMGPEMEGQMADVKDETKVDEWPDEVDEFFYRELLFAKHEEKIMTYIRKRKEAKTRRLDLARKNNELQECQCCFDDEIIPEDLAECGQNHPFCIECVVRSVESALTEGKAKYPCLTGTCEENYPLSLLQEILPSKSFSHVLRRTQEEELRQANIPDLVICPFCPYATVMPDENDKVLRCLNPDCLKESCRLCKEPNHVPQRCDEVEKVDEVKMRTFIENKMAEAMMRECWSCKKKFYKIEGCNKMTCVCGASMCYVCREPINDYEHFNRNQKCNEGHMDNLHNRETTTAAEKAREEYLKDHPELRDLELKNDPTKGLPPKVTYIMDEEYAEEEYSADEDYEDGDSDSEDEW